MGGKIGHSRSTREKEQEESNARKRIAVGGPLVAFPLCTSRKSRERYIKGDAVCCRIVAEDGDEMDGPIDR